MKELKQTRPVYEQKMPGLGEKTKIDGSSRHEYKRNCCRRLMAAGILAYKSPG
jgi:hypothetical protein